MFEFPDVKISKKHLVWIKESLLEKNLLPDYPILVDDKYQILDGKYKFLACYDLGLPVHYKVAEVTGLLDALRVKQICKTSTLKEIIEAYKHVEQYSNLIYLRDHFGGIHYSTILKFVDGCEYKKVDGTAICINKYILASGKLPEFNVSLVEKRITTFNYVMSEFDWDENSIVMLLRYYGYSLDFKFLSKYLRKAKTDADYRLANKHKSEFHDSFRKSGGCWQYLCWELGMSTYDYAKKPFHG